MIKRSHDHRFLESVLNHPEVFPWVCGDMDYRPLDIGDELFTPESKHIFLRAEGGGFVFFREPRKGYDMHFQFLPGCPAWPALDEAVDWVFAQTDAKYIGVKIPQTNSRAQGLIRRSRFKYIKSDNRNWPTPEGSGPFDHFKITREEYNECHG